MACHTKGGLRKHWELLQKAVGCWNWGAMPGMHCCLMSFSHGPPRVGACSRSWDTIAQPQNPFLHEIYSPAEIKVGSNPTLNLPPPLPVLKQASHTSYSLLLSCSHDPFNCSSHAIGSRLVSLLLAIITVQGDVACPYPQPIITSSVWAQPSRKLEAFRTILISGAKTTVFPLSAGFTAVSTVHGLGPCSPPGAPLRRPRNKERWNTRPHCLPEQMWSYLSRGEMTQLSSKILPSMPLDLMPKGFTTP